MHCVNKQILQRKTELIWCAIKIRTICAVNVDRINPVSDRNSSQRPTECSKAQYLEKGSVESTHKVPTSHYRTKHCHAAVVPLGGLLTHR